MPLAKRAAALALAACLFLTGCGAKPQDDSSPAPSPSPTPAAAAAADRLVLGNVDPAGQLRNGTPESIRAATFQVMEECARWPNFVPSTGCDVPPMSPWENIDAFFAAVAQFQAK